MTRNHDLASFYLAQFAGDRARARSYLTARAWTLEQLGLPEAWGLALQLRRAANLITKG